MMAVKLRLKPRCSYKWCIGIAVCVANANAVIAVALVEFCHGFDAA